MAILAGVKENVLTATLKKKGMSYYQAITAKNIANKTSEYKDIRFEIYHSKANNSYTLITK